MDLPVKYNNLSSTGKRFVREEYARLQKGKCCHCGELLDKKPCASVRNLLVDESLFPPGFFKWPVHLHHDHDTGMTIGAIHNYCNAVLWQYFNE